MARGTKRVCQACETRFYDLARDPIVCPACSAQYAVVEKPAAAEPRTGSFANKTAWRSKGLKRPSPLPEVNEVEEAAAAPETSPETANEETNTGPDDDLVLEQEPDDGDVADLIDNVEEPKEP